ncbi:MAG: hypothetical protein KF819_39285 [Labilithrix sp.]|nr:hypothetical protein [Labilithrix sp.]
MSARAFIVAAILAAAALNAPRPALAQQEKKPAPKVSSIVHLASEVAQGLGQVPAGVLVVASTVASDVPAPKGDELAVKLAAQIAGKLGGKAHPQPAALGVARGLSGRAASLVYLQIEIAKGELRVTADLYPVVSNGWERLRNPVPGPRAHAFAHAPLDAELRGYLTPILLEQAKLHKAKHEEGDVLAVGCGDVDGDGGLELVLVTRARVAVGKIRGGKVVVERAAPWSSIASRAPVPMREPLASVLVSPPAHRGEILVGTTDRGGVALDASLVTRRQLTGLPVPGSDGDACAVPSPENGAFDMNVIACTEPEPEAKKPPAKTEPTIVFTAPATRYDAVAALDLVGKDGAVSQVLAAREPSGKLRLRRTDPGAPKPIELAIEGIGAQLALVDMDLDGVPEIVTTTSAESGDDGVIVSAFTKNGVSARLRFPSKEGVRAVAVCPPEERGVPAVVAVVGSEVWLVR